MAGRPVSLHTGDKAADPAVVLTATSPDTFGRVTLSPLGSSPGGLRDCERAGTDTRDNGWNPVCQRVGSRPVTTRSLTELLGLTPCPPTAKCAYVTAGASAGPAELAEAAALLADDAMSLRMGKSPVLDWWRLVRDGKPAPRPRDRHRAAVEAFVADTFGLPGAPGDRGLIQGFVAELLWHRLVREHGAPVVGRTLAHVEDLSWAAYQQGGDGLVVYELEGGTLVFRLWEIKKHESTRHISATVNRAARQLDRNALKYLAQYTGYGSRRADRIGALYADLVPLWLDEDERAGVGVSVATSTAHAPKKAALGSIATVFPQMTRERREGVIVALPDFPTFADDVRNAVWTGL